MSLRRYTCSWSNLVVDFGRSELQEAERVMLYGKTAEKESKAYYRGLDDYNRVWGGQVYEE